MDKALYWQNREAGIRGQGVMPKPVIHTDRARNRAIRRRLGGVGKGTPTNLGIKEYKRLHGDEPKRVVYFKQEMWKAFRELKED